uniref:Uncharacterized protein n=1 Tax=Babesia bovis TaxID=5865 RepID=S6BH70_BABBO|nr:hypothetical protein [Babesia bovis]
MLSPRLYALLAQRSTLTGHDLWLSRLLNCSTHMANDLSNSTVYFRCLLTTFSNPRSSSSLWVSQLASSSGLSPSGRLMVMYIGIATLC